MTQSYPRTKVVEKSGQEVKGAKVVEKSGQEVKGEKDGSGRRMVQRSHSIPSIPLGTEYRDSYRPFIYGYKVLPVVVPVPESGLSSLVRDQVANGHMTDGQATNGPVVIELPSNGEALQEGKDGPILVSVQRLLISPRSRKGQKSDESIKMKTRKTEYKAKFRPFSAYVYIPGNGFKKAKDIDPLCAKQVNDWMYEVTERTAKAAEFSRRSKFGHPIIGDHLEEIYAKESLGPWYTQFRDQNDTLRNEITLMNSTKGFRRGSIRAGSASRVETRNAADRSVVSAPKPKRNHSADRARSGLNRGTSPTKPVPNGKPTNGKPTNGKPTNGKPTNGKTCDRPTAPRRPLAKTRVQATKRSELGSSPIGKIWMKAPPSPANVKSPTGGQSRESAASPAQNGAGPKPPPRRSIGSVKPPSTVTSVAPVTKTPSSEPGQLSPSKSSGLIPSGIGTRIQAPTLIPVQVSTIASKNTTTRLPDQKNTIWSRIKEQEGSTGISRGFESSLSHESSFSS